MKEIIAGYHETKKENVDSIISNGFRPSISLNRNHWLGNGVYLFEELYYAVEWAILNDENNKKINTYEDFCHNCAIFSVKVDLENYSVLDISSPVGYNIFSRLKEIVRKNYSSEEYKKIINGGDAIIIKMIEKIEKKQGEKYLSNFDVICAAYQKKIDNKKKKKNSDFIAVVQKQICIKNLLAITEYAKIELENNRKINDLFCLVLKNRSDKNDK